MGNLRGVDLALTHPKLLRHERWPEIRALRGAHYEEVFGDTHSAQEIGRFVDATTEEIWDYPNKGDLRGLYGRARVVSAFRRGNLLGFAYGANSTSSIHTGLIGRAEERAKMLAIPLSPLESRRYVRLREMIGPDELILDAMAVTLLGDYRPKQPVSDYTYSEETALGQRLDRWKVLPVVGEEPEPVKPFGPGADGTLQTHRTNAHASDVIANILATTQATNIDTMELTINTVGPFLRF
jgi:hypothetical protein